MPHLACCRRGASRGACGCGRMPYRGPQAAQDTAEAQAGGATGTCKRPAGAVGCVYAPRSRLKIKTHRHTDTHTHRDTHRHIHTGTHILHRLPAAAMRGWGGVGRLRRFLTPAECCFVATPSTFCTSHQSFHSLSHNMHSLKGHLTYFVLTFSSLSTWPWPFPYHSFPPPSSLNRRSNASSHL